MRVDVIVTLGASLSAAAAQLALLIYSSHILAPGEYAVYALGMTIIQFCAYFSRSGFNQWLYINPGKSPADVAPIFACYYLLLCACAIGMIIAATALAPIWHQPHLLTLALTLIPGYILSSLAQPRLTRIRITRTAQTASLREFGPVILGFCVSALLLSITQSVYSLAFGYIATGAIQVITSLQADLHWSPRRPTKAAVADFYSFTLHLTGQNLAHYAIISSPLWYAAFVSPSSVIGAMSRASQLSSLPVDQGSAIMGRSAYKRFGQLSGKDLAEFAGTGAGYVAIISLPLCTAGAIEAKQIVNLLLGVEWAATAPLLSLFFTVSAARLLYTWITSLLEARRQFQFVWASIFVQLLSLLSGFMLFATLESTGLPAVALLASVTASACVAAYAVSARRGLIKLSRAAIGLILAVTTSVLVALVLRASGTSMSTSWLSLVLAGFVGLSGATLGAGIFVVLMRKAQSAPLRRIS